MRNLHNFMCRFLCCNQHFSRGNLLHIEPCGKFPCLPNEWEHLVTNRITGIVIRMHVIKHVFLIARNSCSHSRAPLILIAPRLICCTTFCVLSLRVYLTHFCHNLHRVWISHRWLHVIVASHYAYRKTMQRVTISDKIIDSATQTWHASGKLSKRHISQRHKVTNLVFWNTVLVQELSRQPSCFPVVDRKTAHPLYHPHYRSNLDGRFLDIWR